MRVLLDTIEKIKRFNSIVQNYDADIDLISGRYVIDAKSIMGIFSLDCSRPFEVAVHGEQAEEFQKELEEFEE